MTHYHSLEVYDELSDSHYDIGALIDTDGSVHSYDIEGTEVSLEDIRDKCGQRALNRLDEELYLVCDNFKGIG